MNPYTSSSGKASGVTAYETGSDFIIVQFKAKEKYTYSYNSAGRAAVEKMKELALAGKGLSTYITKNKPGFE